MDSLFQFHQACRKHIGRTATEPEWRVIEMFKWYPPWSILSGNRTDARSHSPIAHARVLAVLERLGVVEQREAHDVPIPCWRLTKLGWRLASKL